MAIRQMRFDGDEVLRKTCKEVEIVDDNIRMLLDDMMETLQNTDNGAALAANQVGILKRLVVIDYFDKKFKLVNPKIVERNGSQECVEGCLSFPNKFAKTIRPMMVVVEAMDENGKIIKIGGKGEMAKCLCHEIDHLDGRVFLDIATEEIHY